MDLIDFFRTFHPNAEYTFFSSAQGTFSKIDHNLGYESSLIVLWSEKMLDTISIF